jgi:hypothetical protein
LGIRLHGGEEVPVLVDAGLTIGAMQSQRPTVTTVTGKNARL